jgi:hypothetical protein
MSLSSVAPLFDFHQGSRLLVFVKFSLSKLICAPRSVDKEE